MQKKNKIKVRSINPEDLKTVSFLRFFVIRVSNFVSLFLRNSYFRLQRGFTLVEILVAVAIFSVIITTATTTFISVIRTQRHGLAYQELLNQTSYMMEYMSRAVRMARKDITGSCITAKLNYEFSDQCLKFKNYQEECQQFCLEVTAGRGRIKENKRDEAGNLILEDFLTSPDLNVTSFNVTDPHTPSSWKQPPDDNLQPLVSIYLGIEGKERSRIQIQTSISQRNLDVER